MLRIPVSTPGALLGVAVGGTLGDYVGKKFFGWVGRQIGYEATRAPFVVSRHVAKVGDNEAWFESLSNADKLIFNPTDYDERVEYDLVNQSVMLLGAHQAAHIVNDYEVFLARAAEAESFMGPGDPYAWLDANYTGEQLLK